MQNGNALPMTYLFIYIFVVCPTGNDSPIVHRRPTIAASGIQRRSENLVSNAEAYYLYALGPDAFHLVHECGDRLSTHIAR